MKQPSEIENRKTKNESRAAVFKTIPLLSFFVFRLSTFTNKIVYLPMERSEVIEKTKGIITGITRNAFEWKGELTAADIGGWDSLSHMIIIAEIESEFNLKFKLKELNTLTNLDSLVRLIQSKI
jgi:acyl carrier protein